jgi:hypothetical protein
VTEYYLNSAMFDVPVLPDIPNVSLAGGPLTWCDCVSTEVDHSVCCDANNNCYVFTSDPGETALVSAHNAFPPSELQLALPVSEQLALPMCPPVEYRIGSDKSASKYLPTRSKDRVASRASPAHLVLSCHALTLAVIQVPPSLYVT